MATKEKAKQPKIKKVVINLAKERRFTVFSPRFSLNIMEVKRLRSILSKERIKILYTIKVKNPNNIYELAKILERDIKSVRKDLKVLENFGVVRLVKTYKGKRMGLKPEIAVDELHINFVI